MGNQHSASHATLKPRKNVHWKSAGRPAVPGKPDIIPILSDDEPNAITLRWAPPVHDGGAPLHGYQVECNRLGSHDWIRTSPPVVLRPELVLSGLEPPHRYQFRVAALNAVGRSDYSELSDVLTVSFERGVQEAPVFLQHLEDVTVLENDKTEFRVTFSGTPTPTIAWFKDDYEIFSSRRTAITTTDSSSVLVFHQTLSSDEGEVKCTATNRAGHAVTKARLSLVAAPKLRYPRQYEDGVLYEINETVFLKTTIVGKPTPTVEWRHDGQIITGNERVEISNTPKFSMLKIHSARRSDRGEYQIHARNNIGEDTAAFLVTITAPPDPPRRVSVTRQVDKSVTLDWEPPEDDGGCRIGNYVVEYYRNGWNVWLKATTSRKTSVTLFDLIEGSEYRFRVKAESPYGMSAPSAESAPVRIPGRSVDMEFLEVESRIISDVLKKEDGVEAKVSPMPRRKRLAAEPPPQRAARASSAEPTRDTQKDEFMLVLYPDNNTTDKAEKRKSFQLELEDALSPPPLSLSAPELSARCVLPFRALRAAVSSTELLHERAMARFYRAVALQEQQRHDTRAHTDIPHNTSPERPARPPETFKPPEIVIKRDSVDSTGRAVVEQASHDSEASDGKWQHMSFDEDYTASTVSTDGDYSDEEDGSLDGDERRRSPDDEDTYHPRDKLARPSPVKEAEEELEEEESEREVLKPLPLPDPNFVPKPILKRRESGSTDSNTTIKLDNGIAKHEEVEKPEIKEKPKKEEKMTIFKKITKMPVQKSFPFPKILNKSKEADKPPEPPVQNNSQVAPKKVENVKDKVSEEGRTVIDYYTNIVKEYGSHKKAATPLYLNTEDLKSVAEKQQHDSKDKTPNEKKPLKTKKAAAAKTTDNQLAVPNKVNSKQKANSKPAKVKTQQSAEKAKTRSVNRVKPQNSIEKPKPDKGKAIANSSPPQEAATKKGTQQIVLKKTERATVVIPIDYQELEQQAAVAVRSAVDYALDLCLLLLAFWVYFFKDERLAIPFLVLIIYRQLQETLLFDAPALVARYTPSWLKKKTS
ncbi:muscle M-line assembly protein unc-89 [Ostrinia furnacalis]|uniref:muscle M-line assembly protein unc-89 n=1 Tax=Ostrinia furnacalis TaxID=93504 RepID=UPI00104053DD|nr:muscle M-line assembly protein unc-89 [Ostrinia furnacalis]